MAERMVRFKQSTRLGSEIYNERYSSKLWPLVSFVVVVVLACVCVCPLLVACACSRSFKIQTEYKKGNCVILIIWFAQGGRAPIKTLVFVPRAMRLRISTIRLVARKLSGLGTITDLGISYSLD